MRTKWLVGLMLMASLNLVACGSASTKPQQPAPASNAPAAPANPAPAPKTLTNVSLRVDWVWGSEHAAYFVAAEKGFYEKHGLKVEIREGQGSTVGSKLLATKDDDFGIIAAGTLTLSVAQGLPIKSVAVLFQDTPGAVLFPKNKPIKSLNDLYGKKVATLPKSVVNNEWLAVAKMNNIDLSKMTQLPYDTQVTEPLLSGSVDAAIGWTINDGLLSRTKGLDTDWIRFSDLGLKIYTATIATSLDMIKTKPELVKAFVAATLEGWQYTRDNPQEATEIFLKAVPKADRAYAEQKIPMLLPLVFTDTVAKNGLGFAEPAPWEALKTMYKEGGLLKTDVSVNDLYTNEFLPKK